MKRVTISMKAARALEAWRKWFGARLDRITKNGTTEDYAGYEMDLFDATAPEQKRKPRKPRRLRSTRDHHRPRSPFGRAALREHRASVREAVVKRAMDAGGLCECGCGQAVRDDDTTHCYPEARGEMDHFWGRGKGRPPESLETCWFLRPACHLAKTRNQPDAATWLRKFIIHCERYAYAGQREAAWGRLAFVETRSTLGAGLKQRRANERAAYKRLSDMR